MAGIPSESAVGQRILAESRLFEAGVEDRWKMCRDARDLIRYKVDWKSLSPRSYFFRGPELCEFRHSQRFDESETRCAIHCPTIPDLYLSERPGSKKRKDACGEILITLVADDAPQNSERAT